MERTRHPGIYRRGDKYVAVVSYLDGAGDNKQKWLTRSTLAAAKDARRDFLGQLDHGLQPSGGRMTLGDYLNEWLEEFMTPRGERPRPLTLTQYRSIIRSHITPAIGGMRLAELDRRRLRTFYNTLSPMTAMRCHRLLSSALSWAVKERGLLAANPCAAVSRPRPTQREARWLEETEARRMLRESRGLPIEGAIILGLAGGLRVAEMCVSRWTDLNLGTGVLTVGRSWWGSTKSGKTRRLTLPAGQVEALRRVKREQAERLLAVGIRQTDETTILSDVAGRPLDPRSFSGLFRAFTGEHGFEATFHTLRHTCAALLLAHGVDVKTVAERMGHDPAILLRVYAHAIKSADKAAAERLNAVLA